MMKNYTATERRFFDHLKSTTKLADSSIIHYIARIRRVGDMDQLLTQDIDALIDEYEAGAKKAANVKSHGTTSCALKHLGEFKLSLGL
ncbi:MAG: hypothetical protein IIX89_01250 [Oscillospiraceae bacterium]|nr:hypothetical protein [Oscillospiraceae bacterium]